MWRGVMGWIHLAQDSVQCRHLLHIKEISGFLKGGKFPYELSNCQILKDTGLYFVV